MSALLLAVAVALAPAPTRPSLDPAGIADDGGTPSRPAAAAAEEALHHFEAGDYAAARTAIARAYMIEPWPEFLYARAQIERADGHCDTAVEFYRLYLDAAPPAAGARAAREAIAACGEQPPASEDDDDAGTTTPPQPTPRPRPADDALGLSLVAVGGVGLLVGAGLYGGMASQRRAAIGSTEHGAFAQHIDRARRFSVAAAALVSVGAALVVAGTVRLATLGRGARARRRARRTTALLQGVLWRW